MRTPSQEEPSAVSGGAQGPQAVGGRHPQSEEATSRSRYCATRVRAPVAGCTAKSPGDRGVCSTMLYLRRVCIVSGSSLSVAQTTPTVVPDGKKKEVFRLQPC